MPSPGRWRETTSSTSAIERTALRRRRRRSRRRRPRCRRRGSRRAPPGRRGRPRARARRRGRAPSETSASGAVAGRDPEVGVADVAVGLQRRDQRLRGVDRDREADARPRPAGPSASIWELTPITRPAASSSGPPALPGLSTPSVWITLSTEKPLGAVMRRCLADTIAGRQRAVAPERVADRDRRVADLHGARAAELERLAGRGPRARRRSSARSVSSSLPSTRAGTVCSSEKVTGCRSRPRPRARWSAAGPPRRSRSRRRSPRRRRARRGPARRRRPAASGPGRAPRRARRARRSRARVRPRARCAVGLALAPSDDVCTTVRVVPPPAAPVPSSTAGRHAAADQPGGEHR